MWTLFLSAGLSLAPAFQSTPAIQCQLRPPAGSGRRWEGSCTRVWDQTPRLTLERVKTITTGRWASDVEPLEVWAGDISDPGYPNSPIELEVYRGGRSILRTENGWYRVPAYQARDDSLTFTFDIQQPAPPSDLDARIVVRADAILASDAVWNRADDRDCRPDATVWSIYCAMQRATQEVTGGVHHRRPAMQVVREIVDERSAGRDYSHRLMNYNNDRRTMLADVHSLFADALKRISAVTISTPPPASTTTPSSAPPAARRNPAEDLRIVQRAQQILASPDVWDRRETQTCAPDARVFGIYCALLRAVAEVTGEASDAGDVFHDARQTVAFIAPQSYDARLVGYNNDPTTTFADIQAFFRILRNRIVRPKN